MTSQNVCCEKGPYSDDLNHITQLCLEYETLPCNSVKSEINDGKAGHFFGFCWSWKAYSVYDIIVFLQSLLIESVWCIHCALLRLLLFFLQMLCDSQVSLTFIFIITIRFLNNLHTDDERENITDIWWKCFVGRISKSKKIFNVKVNIKHFQTNLETEIVLLLVFNMCTQDSLESSINTEWIIPVKSELI